MRGLSPSSVCVFLFVYGNNVFVGLLVRGKSGLLVFTSMSVACVFVCSTRKAARIISVVFLLFFASDNVCQWKVFDWRSQG